VHSVVRHVLCCTGPCAFRACETYSRLSCSVWAAVSPKRLKLVFHLFGSYDPCMPIVKVNITISHDDESHPGRSPVQQQGVLHRLMCPCLGESTPVVWPRELQDEDRPSVGPLPSECCVSVDWLAYTLQMPVVHIIPGQLPLSHLVLWLRQTQEALQVHRLF
jgi:hypothetical protein